MIRTRIWASAASLLVFATLTAPANAQVASALLVEDGPLPGGPVGDTISSIGNTAVNHAGGYACGVTTTGSATLSHIWGNASGGAGNVIQTEGTHGVYVQTSFESFYGLADDGSVAYSAIANNTMSGSTGLDGVWLNDTPVAIEEEPILTLPGMWWVFGSRPGITAAGSPYWIGGMSDTQGGSSQNRGLFIGVGQTVLLQGGDQPANLPFPIETGASNLDFDYRVSADGNQQIVPVLIDTGSSTDDGCIVVSNAGLLIDGSLVRESTPIPAAAGGLPGENWDNFDFTGITNSGTYFFTGDTDGDIATDEYILQDGAIIYREGDMVDGFVISGALEGAYQNENADIAFIWDIDDPMLGNIEALYLNGMLLLKEGDPVDLDNDGVVEPMSVLSQFTGISTLTVSDRAPDGEVRVYFTADVDTMGTSSTTDDVEGFFCMPVLLPECFLVFGSGPGVTPFNPAGGHTFWTQVEDIDGFQPVLLDDLGELPLEVIKPSFGATLIGDYSDPTPVQSFAAQVLMWNPQVFPQQPEQSSYGLMVYVFGNGHFLTRRFGTGTGMDLWVERGLNASGEPVLRFPFTIPGL